MSLVTGMFVWQILKYNALQYGLSIDYWPMDMTFYPFIIHEFVSEKYKKFIIMHLSFIVSISVINIPWSIIS